MECHPHSSTSNFVVDYGPIYLEEVSIDLFFKSVDNNFKGFLDVFNHEILTLLKF